MDQRPISVPIDVSTFIDIKSNIQKMVMYQVLDDTRCNYVITDAGNLATSSVESGTLHIGKFTGIIQSGDISEIGFHVHYELIPNGVPNQKFKNVSVSNIQFRTIVPSEEEKEEKGWGIRLYDLGLIGKEITETVDPDQATKNVHNGSDVTFQSVFTTRDDITKSFISKAKEQFIKLLREQDQYTLANRIEDGIGSVNTAPLLYFDPNTSKITELGCTGKFFSLCSSITGAAVGAALSPWLIIPVAFGLGAASSYNSYLHMKRGADKRLSAFTTSQLPTTSMFSGNTLKLSIANQMMAPGKIGTGTPAMSDYAMKQLMDTHAKMLARIASGSGNRYRPYGGGKTKRRKNRNKSLKSNSRKYGKYKHNHKRMSIAKSRRRK
jgi:hypothetical protein